MSFPCPVLGTTTVDSTNLTDGTTTIAAVAGVVTIQSEVLVTGGLSIGATGNLVIYGDLTITGNFTITAGGLLTVYGNIETNAVPTPANIADINGSITASGNINFSNYQAGVGVSAVTITATTIRAQNITFNNNLGSSSAIDVSILSGAHIIALDTVTFSNNSGDAGYAVLFYSSHATAQNIIFDGNSTSGDYTVNFVIGTLTATNNIIFSNNVCSGADAGAVNLSTVTLTATNIVFDSNIALLSGGAAISFDDTTIDGTDVIFRNNASSDPGCDAVDIYNSTITGQRVLFNRNAGGAGGIGVWNSGSTIYAVEFILVQNCGAGAAEYWNNTSDGAVYRNNYSANPPSLVIIDNFSCSNVGATPLPFNGLSS